MIWHILFGRLTWDALPFVKAWRNPSLNEMIAAGAGGVVVIGAIATFGLITILGRWRYLWSEWFTSLDHKKIGIMYVVFALIMMSRALIEAVLMRAQQALAVNDPGPLAPDHFAQLFSTHGTIMIFFVGMPLLTGLINFAMPLQIGSRDVAFPFLNSISLWLTIGGGALMMVSLVVGEFSTGGWSEYPPFTELAFNGGVGPDYWIWAVSLSSMGSTLTGLNFAVTVYKMRAPGLSWMRLPLFTWTTFCTSILMIFAMPPLTVATLLLVADRYLGMHFFTNNLGGNLMNYVNLFWLFGHPEVYILILPAFGVYSEVVSAFSSKELYGYTSLVIATMVIAVLSFTVWLHHFFTMGQSADINAFFGIATMAIGIPTGVKIYDWIWTMYWGEVRFTTPMLYAIAFMITFVIGGITGIILATPPLDYMVHNTLFLVAHFHNMLIPGVLYGMIAGYQYWFPKAFGFRLDERWGRLSVVCWVVGFYMAFMPLYVLGASGVPRRSVELFDPSFRPWLYIALVGAFIIAAGLACLFIQLFISVRDRRQLATPIGDPWDARGLEWSISAPPPEYNFATVPQVSRRDAFYWRKIKDGAYHPADHYRDIKMPRNSGWGPVFGIAFTISYFGLVWHIWWCAVLSLVIAVIAGIARSFMRDLHRTISAAEVEARDRRWLAQAAAARPVPRQLELALINEGRAMPEVSEPELRHAGLNLSDDPRDIRIEIESGVFGFWVFLMSDAVLFALLFAIWGTMIGATAGGPSPFAEFDIRSAFWETAVLLTSSFTYGMVSVSLKHGTRKSWVGLWLAVTFLLGSIFIGMERHDFLHMIYDGAPPSRDGALSSFFVLVGMHGFHVSCGLIWILIMAAQILIFGLDERVKVNLIRLGLFWHFLDIIWVGIFSVVYLQGLLP